MSSRFPSSRRADRIGRMTGAATTESPTDQQLVARYQRGETAVYGELYARHAPSLLAFLKSRSPRGVSADDIAQNVWLKVHTSLGAARNEHFRGWLFRIADNALIDSARKLKTQAKVGGGHPIAEIDPAAPPPAMDDPRIAMIRDCLRNLGGEFVSTIIRNKVYGETPAQIAESEGIERATVYTRVSRGLEELGNCVRKKMK